MVPYPLTSNAASNCKVLIVMDAHLSSRQRYVAYCVGFAAFLFQFEAFFVHIALPDMQRELGVSGSAIAQVITIYLLGAVLALLPGGFLGRRFGFAKVFIIACVIAITGTVLSACANALSMLLWFRLIQGVGIGLMVSAGYTLIPMWLERDHLGWGYGIVSQGAGLGMILGLPMGGLVAHCLEWRWVFLVQIPLFAALLVFAMRALPADAPRENRTTSLKGLLERLVRFDLFAYCLLTLFLFQLILGGVRYLAPFYMESTLHMSSLRSSLFMLVYAIGFILASAVAGRGSERYGSGKLIQFSYLLAGGGCLLFAVQLSEGSIAAALLLLFLGVSTGLFSAPNNRWMMSEIPSNLVQEVGSILPVALNLGVVSGISLFQYVFYQTGLSQNQGEPYFIMYGFAGAAFLMLLLMHVLMRRHTSVINQAG